MKTQLFVLISLIFFSCNNAAPKKAEKPTAQTYAQIKKQLETIYYLDQAFRIKMEELEQQTQHYSNILLHPLGKTTKQDSVNLKKAADDLTAVFKNMEKYDDINLVKVKTIIDTYGWLGTDVIGKRGAMTLFLVVQHSDLTTQEKYLPLMKEAVKNKKANPADLALLIDRVEVGNKRPQIYGSQINASSGICTIEPIIDEINVNKRRKAVGLEPLEEYAKHWNITYQLPTK